MEIFYSGARRWRGYSVGIYVGLALSDAYVFKFMRASYWLDCR